MVDEIQLLLVQADFLSDGSRAIWHVLLPPQFQTKLIIAFLPDLQVIRVGKLFEDVRNSFLRHVQMAGQFRQLNASIAKGVEDCGEAFCLNRKVRVLQQFCGDSGHVGVVVVSDHSGSPFDFEKLCLKGGLEAKLFAAHLTTETTMPGVMLLP